MHKHIAIITAATVALAVAGHAAFAQQGVYGTRFDIEHGDINAAGYVDQYVGLARQTFSAESGLLSALGLNGQADAAASAARELQPAVSRAGLERALQQQSEAAGLLARHLAGAPPLAADCRSRFGADVAALAQAVAGSAVMARELAGNRKKLGLMAGDGATQALYLSKALHEHVKQLQQALKAAADFASANGIALPPEVAAAAG